MPIVRELITKLGFITDEKKLEKFDKRVASLKSSLRFLAKAAAVTGGAISAIAFSTAKAGDEIAKTSRRLGINTQALQEWRFAAERAGVGARTFDMAMQRFGRRASEAARGQGEARDALAEMGIQLTDVNGELRDADDLLTESLIALSNQEKAWDRNRLAMKLFDSEGVRMVQLAAEGAEGIERLRATLRDRGGVMDEETIKRSEEFNDAWTDFKVTLLGVRNVLGKDLLPLFRDTFTAMGKWIADNRTLVITIAKVVAGLGILAVVIAAAKVAITGLALAWMVLNSQILLVPLLILAAIAAIALLVEDIVAFTKGKDSLFGRMLEGLKALWTLARVAMTQAFTTAWNMIRTEGLAVWEDIVARVSQLWGDFFDQRIQPILDAFEKVKTIVGAVSAGSTAAGLPGIRSVAAGAASAAAGSTLGPVVQAAVNIVVNPPVGTSAEGVASATASLFKSKTKELAVGLIGLGTR
jgi:hypothetical protein